MKPIYALHLDSDGKVLDAGSFAYDFEMDKWLRALAISAGDSIKFEERAIRADEEAPALQAVA